MNKIKKILTYGSLSAVIAVKSNEISQIEKNNNPAANISKIINFKLLNEVY